MGRHSLAGGFQGDSPKLGIKLAPHHLSALDALAERRGESRSALIRAAILRELAAAQDEESIAS